MSWIYLCLLNSIKHHISCFIYHLDGQRDTLKQFCKTRLYRVVFFNRLSWSGFIKTWMSRIYLCLLNSIKHPIFYFIYHLDGQKDTLNNFWLTRLYVLYLSKPESTYAFWIATKIIFFALSTIWMVKEIPLNNIWQTRLWSKIYL